VAARGPGRQAAQACELVLRLGQVTSPGKGKARRG
jgi:hypothetical protein